MKKYIGLCICLIAVAAAAGQSRSKRVKQPRPVKQPNEVLEAYRACGEFQRLLAQDLDFDRAFEATFTKDPARRRELAIVESQHLDSDLSQIDTATLVDIYKEQAQLLVLLLPLMFAGGDDAEAELFPPPVKAIFERKPPSDPQKLQEYAAQLKRDVAEFRTHVDKVAANNPAVAKNLQEYKGHLLKPLELPNRVVKPMTGYSKGRVLRPDEEYYQIDDCAVVREGGQMKLIGYRFITLRF